MSAASCRIDFRRGTKAVRTAPATTSTCSTCWTTCRSGTPAAWYCPQPQIENGESRSSWKPKVRSAKTRAACSGSGSSRRIRKAATVAPAKPSANRRTGARSPFGYESQSGASSSAANFVHPASATAAPRAQADDASQNPQIRNAGMIASFVFEFDA